MILIIRLDQTEKNLLSSKMKNGKTVDENLLALISKIGEKITIGRSISFKFKLKFKVFKYHHTIVKDNLSKLGVIVSLKTSDNSEKLKTFGKQLSMHIAALNPLAINTDDIDPEILKKEEELISEELKNLGKPEDIVKKISIGKIK